MSGVPTRLQNNFSMMRHGQSRPNVDGVIICAPDDGIDPINGLTELGRRQAHDSATAWAATTDRTPVIISSDFSRATETADELRRVTGAGPVRIDIRLRERDFGPFHGGPVSAYDQVWAADAAGRTLPDVESVDSVLHRTSTLITELDSEHQDQELILVCHGDTAQITVAAFAGLRPAQHRELPGLTNAEIRALS